MKIGNVISLIDEAILSKINNLHNYRGVGIKFNLILKHFTNGLIK